MKTALLCCLLLQTACLLEAQSNYSNSCEIRDGKAYGYLNNFREAFTLSGKVWFYFYDCQGKFISSHDSYEYEYVSKGAREEIENTFAPSGACQCEFITEGAVPPVTQPNAGNGNTAPAYNNGNQPAFTTDCEIRNGTAYGFVNAYQNAMTVDGTVYFYFYDAQGNYISTEDEHEYEYVTKGSREEIETTLAPRGACRCQFSVDESLR